MIRIRVYLFACVLAQSLVVQGAELPSELAFLPKETVLFTHVKMREIASLPSFKDYRDTFRAMDPKLLKSFMDRFQPRLNSFDTFTAFLIIDPNQGPSGGAIIRFTEKLDLAAFVKFHIGDIKPTATKVGSVYVKDNVGLRLINDNTLLVAGTPNVAVLPNVAEEQAGWLKEAIVAAANAKTAMALAANLSTIPVEFIDSQLPAPFNSLAKLDHVLLTTSLEEVPQFRLAVTYPDETAAKSTLSFIKSGIQAAKGFILAQKQEMLNQAIGKGQPAPLSELPAAFAALLAAGGLDFVDELLEQEYFTRKGATLFLEARPQSLTAVTVAGGAVAMGLMLPAIQKVRAAAARTQSQNNLKQIGIALHNYHDTYQNFPADILDKKTGKRLLSWRVQILPFIEQEALYRRFKLDEPWDSPNNKPLSEVVVKIFTIAGQPEEEIAKGLTRYQGFQGADTIFPSKGLIRFTNITDGSSNTIAVVEAEEATPWTKPGGLDYGPKKPLPPMSKIFDNGFNALLADGSVRFISNSVAEDVLRAMITTNGGEVIDENKLNPVPKVAIPFSQAAPTPAPLIKK